VLNYVVDKGSQKYSHLAYIIHNFGAGCCRRSDLEEMAHIGDFSNLAEAVENAQRYLPSAEPCCLCCDKEVSNFFEGKAR
jgi:hypothetical protein